MIEELKIIKKKYGESMMHFCREHFSSLLETEGLLLSLLLKHFHPSHDLFSDIKKEKLEGDFKNYIYSLVDVEDNNEIIVNKTPKELLSDAGYSLFECTTEKEIQSFKKYYAKGEALCTFNGGRLEDCYVFFAVKKDVEGIKREDYSNPQRQDEYGTSVISIQFTKDETHTLSIKNRYNHTVNNPDATFSNNLDNIIPGLTESFEKEYGLVQKYKNDSFGITNYVRANDGKYYKFNYEIENIYYCPDNIVISNYKAKQYEKEKYIVFDYFILDLVNKEILFNKEDNDSLPETIGEIENIKIENKHFGKEIYIFPKEGEEILIALDKDNRIIKYKNNNVKEIEDDFLYWNTALKELDLPNVEEVGDNFLQDNVVLMEMFLPNIEKVGTRFLSSNQRLDSLELPKLEEVGNFFLNRNKYLETLKLPNLRSVGAYFLDDNQNIRVLELPTLEYAGDCFLYSNKILTSLRLLKLRQVEDDFCACNRSLTVLEFPNLEEVGKEFFSLNREIEMVNLQKLKRVGDYFLHNNKNIVCIELPSLEYIGSYFLSFNEQIKKIDAPNLKMKGKRQNQRIDELLSMANKKDSFFQTLLNHFRLFPSKKNKLYNFDKNNDIEYKGRKR